ncbi:BZ3500_MvSof-1268-A1-R1_Chr2-2g04800 [Microbotryum saponariae]|uniref:BZ3500_MvSof-1268-A1-R1_Chr2-2g04800 protein n=1 Tax=Microbotryum saponariae TaxID=289078 RepID=A0A2X0M6V7_9BASI|nr:BZ3500_MvSof-1268-A1-R1_Chr2-2g04800 [Microbotryum saponariae]SDA00191.1 BZ3501_MvSof-1269-A2-R1_Chr2-2g04474 [Microbotryum saponariae]
MGEISRTWWIVIGIATFFVVVISLVFGLQLVMRCNQRSRDRQMEEGKRANKILGKTRESSSGSASDSTDSLDKEKENMSTVSSAQLSSLNLASRPLSAAPSFSTLPIPHTVSTIPTARSPQGYAVHPLHNAERLISKSYDSLRSSPLAGPPTTSSASVTGGPPSRASSSLSKNSSPPSSPKIPKSSTSRSTASRTPSPSVVQEDSEEGSTAGEPSGDSDTSAAEEEAQRPVEAAGSPSSSTAPRLSLSDLPHFDTGLMGEEITRGDHGKEA